MLFCASYAGIDVHASHCAHQSPHVRESGIQQFFAVGIRNPEDWNPESTMVWNPESTMVWIPESRKLESGIQHLHGFSYIGRHEFNILLNLGRHLHAVTFKNEIGKAIPAVFISDSNPR